MTKTWKSRIVEHYYRSILELDIYIGIYDKNYFNMIKTIKFFLPICLEIKDCEDFSVLKIFNLYFIFYIFWRLGNNRFEISINL